MTAHPQRPVLEAGEGPVLAFGGPYSNLQALEALLAEAAALGVPADRIVCTGDIVAYCGDPAATARRVAASGIAVVAGNCEAMAAAAAGDCGCGFDEGSACAALSADWWRHVMAELDGDARAWMAGLPPELELRISGKRLLVTHAAPGVDNRFIFPSDALSLKAGEIAAGGLDGIVAGHSGLPFAQVVEGRLWLNAGAIGMPANDGTPRGWYALLTGRPDGLEIALRPLAYDHAGAAAAMAAKAVAPAYADALRTGRWPSEDILPAIERAAAGRPLSPRRLFWPARPIGPSRTGREAAEAV